MNVQKAIEIKARTGDDFLNTDPDDIEEADRLSTEALKRENQYRENEPQEDWLLLPGETRE